jgi:hypothetical protein
VTPEPAKPEAVEVVLARVFAPLHKRVFGTVIGLTAGVGVFLVTAFHVVVQPPGGPELELLANYFYGYEVTWRGSLIGAWWGFVAGFAAGFFAAFVRNFAMATWLFFVRTKAHLEETRDFLDHI